jgi:hypothetical protein
VRSDPIDDQGAQQKQKPALQVAKLPGQSQQ